MARGQILTIPNQTAQLVTTLSREQKTSLSLLNPNDGVCYVKMNGPATNQIASWDYKVPSQSYCQLPGPWESLGIYYLDQSGSGRTAEVNVYELDSQIAVPSFIAIGRAVQAAGSAVDISQGSQPSNPPASTVRLWADGSGNLHFVDSTGADRTVIDSTTALGADLYGTITAAHVGIRNASSIQAYDTGGTRRAVILYWSDNITYFNGLTNSGIVYNLRRMDNVSLATLDASGNFTLTGVLYVSGFTSSYISANASYLYLGNANGVVLTGPTLIFSNNGAVYIQYDGASLFTTNQDFKARYLRTTDGSNGVLYAGNGDLYFRFVAGSGSYRFDQGQIFAGTLGVSSWIYCSTIYLNTSTAAPYLQNAGGSIRYWVAAGYVHSVEGQVAGTGYGTINCANITLNAPGFGITLNNGGHAYLSGTGYYAVVGGTNNNGQSFYCAGGAGGPTGWQTISNKKYKSNIKTIDDPLGVVLNPKVNGYYYTLTPPVDAPSIDPPKDKQWVQPSMTVGEPITNYGFMAEEWAEVAPDLVHFHEGEAHMMDYSQVGVLLFEAFRNYVSQTNGRLDKLEANLKQ